MIKPFSIRLFTHNEKYIVVYKVQQTRDYNSHNVDETIRGRQLFHSISAAQNFINQILTTHKINI